MAININGDTFSKEVLESDIPVLVDFWGPRCAPCLALMPAVEAMEAKYDGKMKLVKVDASQNKRFCLSMKVLSLPTCLFYKDGKEVDRLKGEGLTIDDIETSLRNMIE
ncbi:MAG: thioredoxin family protein [Dehalococcoidia bacterium]